MRSTLRIPLFALAGLAFAAPAFAADPGWYTDLRGGAKKIDDMTFADPATANMTIDPRIGWTIQGTVGYKFASPWRVALQAGYHENNIRGTFTENAIGTPCGVSRPCLGPDVTGDISGPSMFGMAFYDIPMSERLTLSLGGGVGAQRIDMTARAIGTTGGVSSPFTLVDAADTVFASRASAELAYNMGSRTDLTLGYTYTHSADASLPGNGTLVPFTFKDNMASHAVTAGFKLAF